MNNIPPRGGGRGLEFFIQHGDLDAMDGLVPAEEFGDGAGEEVDDLVFAGIGVIPPNFAARIGLHETCLTRAISSGRFDEAELLINEAEDPEYLNEGAHSATPLALVLTGRTAYYGQPRHLRLAKLLVEKGANVNLRIPNHDLETASESPLELLVLFYLSLLRLFHSDRTTTLFPGRNKEREYIEMDLLDTIGMNSEERMSPQVIIEQTKELVHFFLDHGADINLQTTEAGRTIFHVALAAEVLDQELVDRMVTQGALVNLTDVHGTTPLMDVIKCRERDRGVETFAALSVLGKRLLLDAQNCSGESALFRSMFNGKNSMTYLLLDEGAASFSMARVQENPQPGLGLSACLQRRPCISNLPSLLAPLLGDSPCFKNAAKRLQAPKTYRKKFNAFIFNEIVKTKLSPFVDLGWYCTLEVEKTIRELLKAQTNFGHLTNVKVFQEIAIIPLMFGNHSGGLRQLCIRQILNSALFSKKYDAKTVLRSLSGQEKKLAGEKQSRSISEPKTWKNGYVTLSCGEILSDLGDSLRSNSLRFSRNMSQPNIPFITSTPQHQSLNSSQYRLEAAKGDAETSTVFKRDDEEITRPSSSRQRRIGDNWLLQENQQYEQHRMSNSSDGLELVISHSSEGDEVSVQLLDHYQAKEDPEVAGVAEAHESVIRMHKMLQETNEMLAKLQTDVDQVQNESIDRLDQSCGVTLGYIDELSEEIAKQETMEDIGNESEIQPCIVQLQSGAGIFDETTRTSPSFERSSCFSSSGLISTSSSSKEDYEESDVSEEENCFSFRNVSYDRTVSNSQSLQGRLNIFYANHETVIKQLNVEKIGQLAKTLGLPPGLKPCFELEIARLQLALAVFRHRSINCDRGCEGDDNGSSTDSDTSFDPNSFSEPSLTMSNTDLSLADVTSDLSFEPSVPTRPRYLTGSSSDSSISRFIELPEIADQGSRRLIPFTDSSSDDTSESAYVTHFGEDQRGKHEREEISAEASAPPEASNEWFSFQGGDAEEESMRRYVIENLGEGFNNSTDSSSSSEEICEERGATKNPT